jgi:hypothetical protein
MAEEGREELAEELRTLRAQVAVLQADVRRLEASGLSGGDHGWAVDEQPGEPSLSWISTLEAPSPRRLAIPRLVLEVAFLVLVAVLAVLAELDTAAIVAVMGAAWLLVAFAEWAASRADRRHEELLLAPTFVVQPPPASDPAWFAPPVEHTILQTPDADPGADTGAATLPPLAESEQTAERRRA